MKKRRMKIPINASLSHCHGSLVCSIVLVVVAIPAGALAQSLFDIPKVENPKIREGTYDISNNQLPDYWNSYLDRLSSRLRRLWKQGYPKPTKSRFVNYNSLTLEYLEKKVSEIKDPCEQAVFAKLFLDASQDDYVPVDIFNTPKEKFAEVGLDILLTKYLPNNYFDVTKWGKDLLVTPGKGISELKIAAKLWNWKSYYEALSKIATGTQAGQIGRWKFAIYQQARKEGWTVEQIEQERRKLLQQNEALLEKIKALNAEMEQKMMERKARYEQRLEEIQDDLLGELKRIEEDEAVDGETRRRLKQLSDTDFVVPGTLGYRPGEAVAGRPSLEEMRQRYLADAKNYYARAREDARIKAGALKAKEIVTLEWDVRKIGKEYNQKIAVYLGKLAKISAENKALKKYALPVAAGECEKLRRSQRAYVSTHYDQKDWYCTNRPVIELVTDLSRLIRMETSTRNQAWYFLGLQATRAE